MLRLHYERPGKGCYMDCFATSEPYALKSKERLEKRIKSLHKQRIDAVLKNDAGEIVGEVDTNLRNWWYDPSVFDTAVTTV